MKSALKNLAKFLLNPLIKRIKRNEAKINELNERIKGVEFLLNAIINNPEKIWLYRNKGERMDPTIEGEEIFADVRKKFHLERYLLAANHADGKIVADIACGTGYGTKLILTKGKAKKCFGVDIAEEAIEYARKHHNHENAEFIACSAIKTPFETCSIDMIVSFETIEHIAEESLLLMEYNRILKHNGDLVISTPNKWPLSIMDFHSKEYDYFEFRRVLESSGFQIDKMFNQNSGHNWEYNRGQPEGIIETTEENYHLAECFIAVCRKNAK